VNLARDLQTDSRCPDTRTLVEHVTSKWGVLVLIALDGRTLRWSELKREISGVSEKMLIQTLQTLESDALVLRDARPVVPPHVEYSLTDAGHEAVALLAPLVRWAYDRAQGPAGRAPVTATRG
jgi:DNA-binding HxlR family transcriptional regulator